MLRMLHALVGDRPDGLTLIGDGQQTIYTGGYSLAEAGISVAGRGVVMSTNYRNTREIASFAVAIVEGDEFVDLEGGPGRADAALAVPRTGPSPRARRRSRRTLRTMPPSSLRCARSSRRASMPATSAC